MLAAVLSIVLTTQVVQDQITLPSDYKAMRQGSHNPDVKSNGDQRPMKGGETLTLLDAQGPGMVTHIWMTIADNEYAWPRLLRLRVYYDGAKNPSVDTPLGDFFACGHGTERDVNSLMVRNTSQGRAKNSYWQMPYLKSCKITLTNEGEGRAGLSYWQVDYRKYRSLPKDILYFHALYRQEFPAKMGQHYNILDTKGRGKYVGTVLSVLTNEASWFGEGDEYFYVDGEKDPSLSGTGTEDFFSDAWGLHDQGSLYAGTTQAGGFSMGDRPSAYRWQINDPVPFQKSLRLDIEHAGWTNKPDGTVHGSFDERPDDFSSVAFWYQTPFRTDLPEVPYGKARLPLGNATIIQAEANLARATGVKGSPEIQKEVFWLQDILFFSSKETGAELEIPFDVPSDAQWEVVPMILSSYDFGNYEAYMDGKKVGPRLNLYSADTGMPRATVLGRFDLKKGEHKLKFVCVGKSGDSTGYFFGIDQIVLAKVDRVWAPAIRK